MIDAKETTKLLEFLTEEVLSVVIATIGDDGLPHTSVINLVMHDDDSVYFLTASGKKFYDEIKSRGYLSLTGMKGEDTLSTVSVTLAGKVSEVGPGLVDTIFEKHPYLFEIYSTQESRKACTVFRVHDGVGELFDLSVKPPRQEAFTFGNAELHEERYVITDACTSCGVCVSICPTQCISDAGAQPQIDSSHCIRCGNCLVDCEYGAIKRTE